MQMRYTVCECVYIVWTSGFHSLEEKETKKILGDIPESYSEGLVNDGYY